MTRSSDTPNRAPQTTLSAPEGASTPRGGTERRPGGLNGPQTGAQGLDALLARLIADAAHHTRCAEYGRELGRPADLIGIHDGFAAGFTEAACYTAELIATGALQWRGGHHVPGDDEAAAARLAGGLADTAPERARQILRAIREMP